MKAVMTSPEVIVTAVPNVSLGSYRSGQPGLVVGVGVSEGAAVAVGAGVDG